MGSTSDQAVNLLAAFKRTTGANLASYKPKMDCEFLSLLTLQLLEMNMRNNFKLVTSLKTTIFKKNKSAFMANAKQMEKDAKMI